MKTQTSDSPQNPVQAATHPNPYSYYRDLIAQRPIYYDDSLHLWVAASASAVKAVLHSELCRVRPLAEPVPKLLLDSAAGVIFQHWARMNDGGIHSALKPSISMTMMQVDLLRFRERCDFWAEALFSKLVANNHLTSLIEFAHCLPVYVMGEFVGIPQDRLDETVSLVRDFVVCLSPLSSAEQIEGGKQAAAELLYLFRTLIDQYPTNPTSGLLNHFALNAAQIENNTPDRIAANGIGFLTQPYEATAGLIGNTIVTLTRHLAILQRVKTNVDLLSQVIREVLRYDPPIQNTRRFVAMDGLIAGENMREGDSILVLLAAANHDVAANPDPERFDICRQDRQLFTFGSGIHGCPGLDLAAEIAHAAVSQWITKMESTGLPEPFTYQASVNARIPLLHLSTSKA